MPAAAVVLVVPKDGKENTLLLFPTVILIFPPNEPLAFAVSVVVATDKV